MTAPAERTPEQRRADRKAGFGCAGLLALSAVALAFVGSTLLSNEGTPAKARILSCDLRLPRQPSHCRGIWSLGGEFHQGYVGGVGESNVGERVDVRVSGGRAEAERGRSVSAFVLFGFAALCLVAAVSIGRSVWRQPVPPG